MTGRINQIATDAVSVLLVVLLPVSGLPRRAPRSVCWCVCIGTSCAGCLRCLRGNCVSCRGLSCAGSSVPVCCNAVLQQWRSCFKRPAEACVLFARRSTSCCFAHRLHIYVSAGALHHCCRGAKCLAMPRTPCV